MEPGLQYSLLPATGGKEWCGRISQRLLAPELNKAPVSRELITFVGLSSWKVICALENTVSLHGFPVTCCVMERNAGSSFTVDVRSRFCKLGRGVCRQQRVIKAV